MQATMTGLRPRPAVWGDLNGSHRQGYITATRRDLEAFFGKPGDGDGDKVTTEWLIVFEDAEGSSIPVTIYDWKYGSQPSLDTVYQWHIGGFSSAAVEALFTYLWEVRYE